MATSKMQRIIGKRFSTLTTGGDWALAASGETRRNLTKFWFDGLFAAASDTIPINYLTLYLLALGANSSQVGLFSSLTSLAAAIFLLPGAFIVERYGNRHGLTVWFGGVLGRVMLIAMAVLPFFLSGKSLIWVVIGLAVIRSAAGNIAFPAWMAIIGDIVPMEGRGRYFGSRNFVMTIASIVMTYLVGEFITRVGSPKGYQISLTLAFIVGMLSTFYFSQIRDVASVSSLQVAQKISIRQVWFGLKASPLFIFFCFTSAVWNFALNIAGPFFNVYMVQNLKFTAAMVGVAAISTSITKILIQNKVGELSDRWGPARVQMLSMFLIPALPIAWIFSSQLWHVVLINVVGGVLWGAFELVSFNFLLQITPDDFRARYSAIYQVVVTLALAGGAAVGSGVIFMWGYNQIFILSALGRIVAAFLFLWFLGLLSGKK